MSKEKCTVPLEGVPSGDALGIEVKSALPATSAPQLRERAAAASCPRPADAWVDFDAFFGGRPGDETDEQLAAILKARKLIDAVSFSTHQLEGGARCHGLSVGTPASSRPHSRRAPSPPSIAATSLSTCTGRSATTGRSEVPTPNEHTSTRTSLASADGAG